MHTLESWPDERAAGSLKNVAAVIPLLTAATPTSSAGWLCFRKRVYTPVPKALAVAVSMLDPFSVQQKRMRTDLHTARVPVRTVFTEESMV